MRPWWLLAWTGCVRVLSLDGESAASPDVCIPDDAPGYRLPSVRWGLASLYASRRLADRGARTPQLPPHWFLASAWETTGFGCAAYAAPFDDVDAGLSADQGCLGIRPETVWQEVCRLYPAAFDCEGYAGTLAGDRPEDSAITLAWFVVAAHALLGRLDVDPDQFYGQAGDPWAQERLSAAFHIGGPWLGPASDIVERCGDDVTDCLHGDLAEHVAGVTDKLGLLEAADCADVEVTDADRVAFVGALAERFVGFDRDAALTAARRAEPTLAATVQAVEQAAPVRLACPETELWQWYHLSCP